MNEYDLDKYNLHELKKMARKMELPPRRSKKEMIGDISTAFQEYETYKDKKITKYIRHQQLGEKGKEGTTYLVTDKNNREYAMKTFRKSKSSNTLKREYTLQKKASKKGISPKVYDYDTVSKYIVMEKMDGHLLDLIKKQKGILKKEQQLRVLEIFKGLDETGVFHNDANLCNYMYKGDKIYIIDFGFAKEITPNLIKTLKTKHPNEKLMVLGFILKLKENNAPEKSYKYLKKQVSTEDQVRFGI